MIKKAGRMKNLNITDLGKKVVRHLKEINSLIVKREKNDKQLE